MAVPCSAVTLPSDVLHGAGRAPTPQGPSESGDAPLQTLLSKTACAQIVHPPCRSGRETHSGWAQSPRSPPSSGARPLLGPPSLLAAWAGQLRGWRGCRACATLSPSPMPRFLTPAGLRVTDEAPFLLRCSCLRGSPSSLQASVYPQDPQLKFPLDPSLAAARGAPPLEPGSFAGLQASSAQAVSSVMPWGAPGTCAGGKAG